MNCHESYGIHIAKLGKPAARHAMRDRLTSCFPARLGLFRLLWISWVGLVMSAVQAEPDAAVPAAIDGIQKAVLDELNIARTTPMKYVEHLKDHRRKFKGKRTYANAGVKMMTLEGVTAVDEAIAALSKQAPLAALKFSDGLAMAALDHVQDTGAKGLVSHDGADDSTPAARIRRYGKIENISGECISYGFHEARRIVMALIIDDGVANRGHRRLIYTGEFRLVGIACGQHKLYKNMCVIDFAGAYQDDNPAIRQRQAKKVTNGWRRRPRSGRHQRRRVRCDRRA